MQEGFIGLLDAARRFDRSRGTQFSTYAIWWVRQRISRAIGEQGFVVRLPIYLIETINKIRNAEERLSFRTETIDVDQLCTELELTLDKYLETKKYSYRFLSLASLDAPVSEDDSELMDFIAGATHEPIAQVNDEYIDVESVAMTNFRKEAINDLVATLSDREQTVIRLRFGLDDDQNRTLQQVGGGSRGHTGKGATDREKSAEETPKSGRALLAVMNFRDEGAEKNLALRQSE